VNSRKRLPQPFYNLFREIIRKRCPYLVDALDSTGLRSLPKADWEKIRDEVGEEMFETGIDGRGEVSPRGLLIERLLDYIVENEPDEAQSS